MEYFTAHFWCPCEEHAASLVLQQVYHRERRMPVVLACIQENRQGENDFSRELVDWFYGTGLELCSRYGEKRPKAIESGLYNFLEQASGKEMTGILIIGQRFILFRQGMQKCHLLNTRNHNSKCRELAASQADGKLGLENGILQSGVGILLESDSFYEGISRSMVEECLNMRELRSQKQVEKRLGELGGVARAKHVNVRGYGNGLCAVLIVAK